MVVTVQTKGGRALAIRPRVPEDTVGQWELDQAVVEARAGMVLLPQDLPTTLEEACERHDGRADELRALGGEIWVAEWAGGDGALIAEAQVRRLRPSTLRHVGLVGISVHPDAQGLGVGRKLMEHLLAFCDRLAIHRLELYVRADNERARGMYESFGFEVEGVRRALIRWPDGRFIDDILMAKLTGPAESARSQI